MSDDTLTWLAVIAGVIIALAIKWPALHEIFHGLRHKADTDPYRERIRYDFNDGHEHGLFSGEPATASDKRASGWNDIEMKITPSRYEKEASCQPRIL